MISESDIYWLTRMDGLLNLAHTLTGVFVTSAILFAYISVLMMGDRAPWVIKTVIVSIFFAFVFGIGSVFIPSTKEMAAIKVIPMIANNNDVKGLGEDVIVLAREWMKELKPKAKKEAEKE